jgi:hypothetical protein
MERNMQIRIEAQAIALKLMTEARRIQQWVETAPAVTDAHLRQIQNLEALAKKVPSVQEVSLPNPGAPTLTEWRGKQVAERFRFRTQAEVDKAPLGDRLGTVSTFMNKSIG